ncbi:MAG: amidohydrolase family protein [Candidatus Cloacimonadaceae bacterium]|jgi:guanine deaminase|nr:amidohydrolase family protein [Candidatus Cloacimonadota bacterium]MDD5625434.1 amidohydrolase family protein [Candidatus Cloacimonadota bacterium]MDY0112007.1 amidohydrolase family protein [Candidatus Syntrophosphaera sp.]
MRKIRTNIINPIDQDHTFIGLDYVIAWDDGIFNYIHPYQAGKDLDCEERLDEICIPGLIDIHTHLSQYWIRGRYEPSLLFWLEKNVFPEEALSQNPDFAEKIAEDFFQALFAAGTTTSVIYTAPYPQACEIAFSVAKKYGARAWIGMTLMDQNVNSELVQSTDYAYQKSLELYYKYHNASTLLDYIFSPRFALSCSVILMEKIARFAQDNSAWIQTHLSENQIEIANVLQLFGVDTYTQVYENVGLLTPKTILAHCIHLSSAEMDTLAKYDSCIAHCPDSNFFLKSGEFNYEALYSRNLNIGVGSDVAAGTTLNMLYHSKMVNYRQSVFSLSPERLFYHITLGNAILLGCQDKIGSLDLGKEADLCFLKLPPEPIPVDSLVSALCFYGYEFPVMETVIAGRTVYSR